MIFLSAYIACMEVALAGLAGDGEVVVAHISDLHVESENYSRGLEERLVGYIGELRPDVVVVTGDLTDNGYVHEYCAAVRLLSRLKTRRILVVPGNHDSRNMGHVVFERVFGTRFPFLCYRDICIQGVDSSEPDIDDGHIGRLAYDLVAERLKDRGRLRIVALHHHLIPVPGTGRERNIPIDAGDFLRVLIDLKVNIVLSGHKHVPWMWSLNGMLILHAGTATTYRLKAGIPPSINILYIRGVEVEVRRLDLQNMREETVYQGTPNPTTLDKGYDFANINCHFKLDNINQA